jgi:carbon monoxide dehydrogenase subunit G
MHRKIILTLALLVALPLAAHGHGPTRQKVMEAIVIDASPEAVWEEVKDFGQAHAWLPMVEATEIEGGNEPGATRILKLKGGGEVREVLKKYDAAKMMYSYRIPVKTHDVKLLPVSNYSSTLTVAANEGGGAKVTWKGAFYRGYMNNDPPPELNDEAAVKAVTELYRAGLEKLKSVAEGK